MVLADPRFLQNGHGAHDHSQSEYQLPEMSHGHAATACKADIHALGCLLVEMCTGEPWAAGVFTLNVFEPEADHAKSPLIHIMQRCLCVNADGRPPAAIVRKDLQALQAAENVKAQQALNSQLYVGVHPVQAEATDASSPESPIIPTLEIIPV
ncbi:TPA: hypothetical protein ACH3X3_007579 [Trebouxia sp. C0006]